jgi:lipopolysaccharide heptosyltransferase III
MPPPLKILAIHFKYFGDTIMMIPALRAVREQHPQCELHALVPEEVTPLLQHAPWLNRVWPMPRQRGRAGFRQSWPVIRALRAERFDLSVDFGGNDRGALLSLLAAARDRLGIADPGGFLGRRFCYTRRIARAPRDRHETLRLLHILSAWGIAPAIPPPVEIHTDPAQDALAAQLMPAGKIICHLASSQPKKEWPLRHWAELRAKAAAAGHELTFGTGITAREKLLLDDLQRIATGIAVLPPVPDLATFLAMLKRARAFVSGDTGPLHFAAGVGVPTIGLFGPTSAARWAPVGPGHYAIQSPECSCGSRTPMCSGARHCLDAVSPQQVFERLQLLLNQQKDCVRR